MAVAIKSGQVAIANSGATSTTLTLTLPGAPTAGNLLVMAMGGDKDTGTITLSGFTVAPFGDLRNSAVSLYVYYKVSDGTETSISPTWSLSSVAGNTARYVELEDTAVAGSTWQVSASSGSAGTAANVTSKSTGTTGATTAAGLGFGACAVDSSSSVTAGTEAWTNSYAIDYSATGLSGRGAIFTAKASIGSGVTTETTFSFTGVADNVGTSVTVFSKIASGAAPARLLGTLGVGT